MTELEVRRIPFKFDDTVPFQWHPIAFEKYIVTVTRQALSLISDAAVAKEADEFLRQEAQHSRAHRLHLKALIAQYPGLKETLDQAEADFDRLIETKSLNFNLAYIAAMEASFTPYFKLTLDHADEFLAPGDARVASLLAWHFVEEVEHRSSALVIYDAVVKNRWYRPWVALQAGAHVLGVSFRIFDGFYKHVPVEDAGMDPRRLHPIKGPLLQLRTWRPFGRGGRVVEDHQAPPSKITKNERWAMVLGELRAQVPSHDPEHQPLPDYADAWFEAYERGEDMTLSEGMVPAA